MDEDRVSLKGSGSRGRRAGSIGSRTGSRAGTPSGYMFTRSQCNGKQCSIPGCDHKKRKRRKRMATQTDDTCSIVDGFAQTSPSYDSMDSFFDDLSDNHIQHEETREPSPPLRQSTPMPPPPPPRARRASQSNTPTRRKRVQPKRLAAMNGNSHLRSNLDNQDQETDQDEAILIIRKVRKFFRTTINNTTSKLRRKADSPLGMVYRVIFFIFALLLIGLFVVGLLFPSPHGSSLRAPTSLFRSLSRSFGNLFYRSDLNHPIDSSSTNPEVLRYLVQQLHLIQQEVNDLKSNSRKEALKNELLNLDQSSSSSIGHPIPYMTADEVKALIQDALALYDADKTGIPDYALEPSGGTIVNTRCSETFRRHAIQYRMFGIPIWSTSIGPRAVIQPGINPGECWAFKGATGHLVIRLSQRIIPTAFSYEHIPKQISRDGNINSAPKDFLVKGLKDEEDKIGVTLGQFTYEDNDRPLQYFDVEDKNPGSFNFVELVILTNHGNPEYTCLYRFRVHGKRVET